MKSELNMLDVFYTFITWKHVSMNCSKRGGGEPHKSILIRGRSPPSHTPSQDAPLETLCKGPA